MGLRIIDGGTPKRVTKENASQRISVFVQHMRSIEQSMSMVVRMAEALGWDELTTRSKKNHREILDTLTYVKRYHKVIVSGIQKKNKEPQLSLVSDVKGGRNIAKEKMDNPED